VCSVMLDNATQLDGGRGKHIWVRTG